MDVVKQLLLSVCAIVLLCPTRSAAEPRFGIEAGGSGSWIEYGQEETSTMDFRSRVAFNVAATLHFDFSSTWGLTTGLRYARLGDEIGFDDNPSAIDPMGETLSGTLTNRQNYLGIPVLLRWNLLGQRGLFMFGGGELDWLSRATSEFVYAPSPTAPPNPPGEEDVTSRMNRYNLIAVIGAGMDLTVGDHGVELTARYGHGLVNIVEEAEDLPFPDRKTREVALAVGWRM